jgi:Zn-dependent peptidase ImmA (M78 family)
MHFDSNNIDRTARYFGVSPQAVAIRAQSLRLINSTDDVNYMPPAVPPKSSGGNPYNTALSYNDRRYMSELVAAQENGTVLPTEAASLIGIRYKILDRTIEIFDKRAEDREGLC